MPAWIPYTALRLALFGGSFALVYVLLTPYPMAPLVAPLLAGVAAMIVSLSVSYIFFARLRHRVALEFAESRERSRKRAEGSIEVDERGEDELVEDDLVDGDLVDGER